MFFGAFGSILNWLISFICSGLPFFPFCPSGNDDNSTTPPISGDDFDLECPLIGTSQSFIVTTSPATIDIKILSGNTGLCTLSLEDDDDDDETYIPIARCYDGYDWERSGSRFVADWDEWECNGDICSSTLKASGKYILRNRQVPTSVSDTVKKARFLEMASFGTTRTTLNSIGTFTNYIKEQMDLPATYHREFFRKNMYARWEFNHPKFAASLNPCQANTTWRRQILTEKDRGKQITINYVNSRWQITIDGHIRGLVQQLRYIDNTKNSNNNNNIFSKEENYNIFNDGDVKEFCSNEDEIRRGIYKILNNDGRCRDVIITEDLMIDFQSDGYQPLSILSGTLPALSDGSLWKSISDFRPEYRYIESIDQSLCTNLPNYEAIGSSPVFARTTDNVWLIHDPRIEVNHNTIENPIVDGGQNDLESGRIRFCSNVPRTYQNENNCFMSTTIPTCQVGSRNASAATTGIIVCGSPGEISNNQNFITDSWLDMSSIQDSDGPNLPTDTTRRNVFARQREFIWSDIVLNSPDQLRQRIAWVLYQIFALPISSLRDINTNTEPLIHYYDIFVRYAFGNYMDILREITYSPLQAESLSYINSKSLAIIMRRNNGEIQYPDENFARELMQLFTIGLIKLNIDGTPVLDSNGIPIRTYESDDIMSFARAWTGFEKQSQRSNMESRSDNKIDPLVIIPLFRDIFPKSDLDGGYIGDGYPLCVDLPERSFLRQGAKYRLIGKSPVPENFVDDAEWSSFSTVKRLDLSTNSALYVKLCANQGGACTYPNVVTLDSNLACSGIECSIDTVRVVKVQDVYYEYIHIPCVYQTYFQNPRVVGKAGHWDNPTCIPSNLAAAGAACCPAGLTRKNAITNCLYSGERMLLSTAQERCFLIGMEVCEFKTLETTDECFHQYFRWTSESCQLQVKVNAAGQIALTNGGRGPTVFLRNDTQSYFKAYWENDVYPQTANGCSGGSCSIVEDSCLCNVTESDETVFTSLPSDSSEILTKLRYGHPPPEMYGPGDFQRKANSNYWYYSRDGNCCDIDTFFEVVDNNNIKRYLKNLKSTVTIDQSTFRFRTPVQFNHILPNEYSVAEAEQETDAVLRYLLHHTNTPPFVAYRFIQRFGVSNPSPRYVQTVAEAFKDGEYVKDGLSFGKKEYGDLSATVAAVLLDREVRSSSTGYDPSFGAMREPIVKVLAFFRAVELKKSTPILELDSMDEKMGQMAHQIPSVFSFFRPEFSPPGKSSTARLVAPESEIMTTSKVVGLLNGLFSSITKGLLECDFGFAAFGSCDDNPSGLLSFRPADLSNTEAVIEELSTLLTSGRLDSDKRAAILSAVDGVTDPTEVFKLVLQLIVTSPEFHTSNQNDSQGTSEATGSQSTIPSPASGYKAVIHLALDGGCDSFNVLAPHPSCSALSNEYKSVRGSIALKDSELLQISASGQPCSSFGVHYGLPVVKQLYDDGDLLFVANAGVMTQPVNKDNYQSLTLTQLFAHNSMLDEVSRLDPRNAAVGTGTLGRMAEVLIEKGYSTGRSAIESISLNLATATNLPRSVVSVDTNGVNTLNLDPPSLELYVELLNGRLDGNPSGVFGEEWSKLLRQGRNQTDELVSLLDGQTQTIFGESRIAKRMSLIAQLIGARDARRVDRDFFFVTMKGYDTHNEVTENLELNFLDLNEAIEDFITEMKLLGVWDDVVIVQTSDFGRTLTPNSGGGTDHAWGGNYWVTGGNVKGGRIIGKYPSSLNPDQDIGRGRLIPTTPFDSIFNAVADWVGINNANELDKVLPNRNNFPSLFSQSDLFN